MIRTCGRDRRQAERDESPALSEAMKPLDRLEASASEVHAEQMRDFKTRQRLAEMNTKAIEKKAQEAIHKTMRKRRGICWSNCRR